MFILIITWNFFFLKESHETFSNGYSACYHIFNIVSKEKSIIGLIIRILKVQILFEKYFKHFLFWCYIWKYLKISYRYLMLYIGKWQQINTGYKQGEEMKKRQSARSKNELLIGHISHWLISMYFFTINPKLYVQDLSLFFVLATFLTQPKEAESSSSTIVAGQTYAM